jgi:hypothetical protein
MELLNSSALLDKSLAAGQISTLEYFMECSFYFESLDKFMQLELQFHESLSELMKHEL